MLETKAKDQGHKRKCSPKTKVFKKFFSGDLKKVFKKFFQAFSSKKRLLKFFFQAIYKISAIQKKVLSSSRGQANFQGLEAKDFKTCPQGLHRRLQPYQTSVWFLCVFAMVKKATNNA